MKPRVTFHAFGSVGKCAGMNPHTPNTLPSELPLGELKSRWTPKFLKSDCKGQNPLYQRVPYNIENLLKPRFIKWARMTHLGS
jgi:hypothetical protein